MFNHLKLTNRYMIPSKF